jgi:hypothetical protein
MAVQTGNSRSHDAVIRCLRFSGQRDRIARTRGRLQRAESVTRKTKSRHAVKRDGSLLRLGRITQTACKIFRRFRTTALPVVMFNSLGGELMGARRPSRIRSRMSKSRCRRPKSSEHSTGLWPESVDDDDQAEKTDRLLLSSLRYWEVERDLIEERMAARLDDLRQQRKFYAN